MRRIITISLLLAVAVSATAQWSSNPANALWVNDNDEYFYGFDIQQAPNGNTWFYYNGEGDAHYVQLYDSTGVALLGEEMMLISDYPDRLTGFVGENLFVDRDGNAIVVVSDLRHSEGVVELGTYTAYKISQEGEMLWGEEGISIDGAEGTFINAFMGITQLSDGSYVFTWTHCDEDEIFSVDIQRVTPEGDLLWDAADMRLTDPEKKVTYFWPYVVDAGYGQCILVYTKGSNLDLYARKIDFDGSLVWSEDTRIYRSGFLPIPLYTVLDVQPSGDGGVLVSWYDDRNSTATESIYMSYVKPNGELGFTSGEIGEKLSYSGYRALSSACCYDPASDTFIAFWREANQGQGAYRLVAQSVSKEGELLWGEEGLEIEPMVENNNYTDLSIQPTRDGELALFFLRKTRLEYGDVDACMQRVNTLDGTLAWDESRILTDTVAITEKAELKATTLQYHNYAIFGWDDRGVTSDVNYKRLYLNRVNYDGSVGCSANSAVESISVPQCQFSVVSTHNDGKVLFAINASQVSQATMTLYNMSGAAVATPFSGELLAGTQYIECDVDLPTGIYIATLTTNQYRESVVLTIK